VGTTLCICTWKSPVCLAEEDTYEACYHCCGKSKIWAKHPDAGPTAAKDAYTGSYFRANRRYAEAQGCDWMILSGKYGLIEPDFIIPGPYNVTFKDLSTHPVTAEYIQTQVFKYQLARYCHHRYSGRTGSTLRSLNAPLAGWIYGLRRLSPA